MHTVRIPRLRHSVGEVAKGSGYHLRGARRPNRRPSKRSVWARAMTINRHADIRYHTPEACRLDVYIRRDMQTQGNTPVVMIIHGGGWMSQTKESARDMALNLADEGFCAITPSYTKSPLKGSTEPLILSVPLVVTGLALLLRRSFHAVAVAAVVATTILACISIRLTHSSRSARHAADIARAVAWAHGNISHYGGCPRGIVMLGHSAGANIATVVATNYSYTRRQGIGPNYIRAVIGISGPYNDIRLREAPLLALVLYTVFGYRENYRKFFPMYSAKESAPPHLLFAAERDYTLYSHARDYRRRLRSIGVPVDAYMVSATNHYTIRKYWSGTNAHVRAIVAKFIRKHLTPTPYADLPLAKRNGP